MRVISKLYIKAKFHYNNYREQERESPAKKLGLDTESLRFFIVATALTPDSSQQFNNKE